MYKKDVADNGIANAVLRDFGIVILEEYQQQPLIRKLDEMVAHKLIAPSWWMPFGIISDSYRFAQFRNDAPTLWFCGCAGFSDLETDLSNARKKGIVLLEMKVS